MIQNSMGSNVEEGYKCKPSVQDINKPIMFYKTHILICTGERCSETHDSDTFVDGIREITKEIKLNRGKNRIKLTRANCFGACRFKGTLVLYKNPSLINPSDPSSLINSFLWLKQIQTISDEKWKDIFNSLANDTAPNIRKNQLIPMQVY